MTTHTMLRMSVATAGLLALLFSTGCFQPPADDGQAELGLVYMLPGMDGNPGGLDQPYKALRDGGVDSEIRVLDWSRGWAALDNLTDYAGNLLRAADIAAEIAAYREAHPAAPIDLVGYSAGGGLAVLIAGVVPEESHVRNVVLVQAAISPDYDLEPALSHIDGKLVNFYSPNDWLILGLGTSVFGTMDRSFTASAGRTGFDLERAVAGGKSAAKVEQICWTPEMIHTGHLGMHMTMFAYEWNKEYVAPYLLPVDAGE